MTLPKARTVSVGGARTYSINIDGVIYPTPSPNTLKGLLDAPALGGWKMNRAIEASRTTANLADLPELEFRRVIRAKLNADTGAMDLGNRVHEIAEAILVDDPLPGHPEESWAVETLVELGEALDLEPMLVGDDASIELTIVRIEDGIPVFAGTTDGIVRATVNGARGVHVVDWKSGASIYPDAVLTTAAYMLATHYVDPYGRTVELPFEIDGGLLAHLRPDGWKVHPIPFDDALVALELLRLLAGVWRYKIELEPPVRPALKFK